MLIEELKDGQDSSCLQQSEKIPINFRGLFFHDVAFSNSWPIIEHLKTEYETQNQIEHGKFSVEKDLPLRSCLIKAPDVDDGQVKYYPVKLGGGLDAGKNQALEIGMENYQVLLDVSHFRLNEITVSKSSEYLIIEGKHEEKSDPIQHGYISRSFIRKYKLPCDLQPIVPITANCSADGILLIELPKIPSSSNPIITQGGGEEESQVVPGATNTANGSSIYPLLLTSSGLISIEEVLKQLKTNVIDPIWHALPDFHVTPIWHRLVAGFQTPKFGVQSDTENFKILVNVKEFQPEELAITANDYTITIEGSHQEKGDGLGGSIERSFTHTFDLPKCIGSALKLQCNYLAGGILEISAPKTDEAIAAERSSIVIPLNVTDEAQGELDAQKEASEVDLDSLNYI